MGDRRQYILTYRLIQMEAGQLLHEEHEQIVQDDQLEERVH